MAAGMVGQPGGRDERIASLRASAVVLTGLLRGADRRGDRPARAIYAAALGDLAELAIARHRDRLP